jgi:hypothetical protein
MGIYYFKTQFVVFLHCKLYPGLNQCTHDVKWGCAKPNDRKQKSLTFLQGFLSIVGVTGFEPVTLCL